MSTSNAIIELRQKIYDLRLRSNVVQQAVVQTTDPDRLAQLLQEAGAIEAELAAAEAELQTAEQAQAKSAAPRDEKVRSSVTRSMATTQLEAAVRLRMAHVPTATYHLLDAAENPLVEITVENGKTTPRRLRITSRIEGYSAEAIDTIELTGKGRPDSTRTTTQLPTLFPERIRPVQELTRATVNVLVEEIGGKIETHETLPVWLLARNAAPLAVRNPASGGWIDLSRYFGAFVTPNQRDVMRFLRHAANLHPEHQLAGYQSDVTLQARAIFDALKQQAGITYVNSLIAFNPDESARGQRVRLPRETLEEQQANCIDGTLLFASLLEAISINPALVIVPGHAFVGWETGANSGEWDYLETTMIGSNEFEDARKIGQQKATFWEKQAAAPNKAHVFRRWSLRDLRTIYRITPLE
ncbi:MAG: hypothetical protein BroJett021_43510 [Chloroflexota bacterium]|nr:transglutaminase-like domain-containing protein [Caldilinea sp.]GIK75363.1 MAG: hypothetical protein BroJett021_43510 [Chloroflexota bacterium]